MVTYNDERPAFASRLNQALDALELRKPDLLRGGRQTAVAKLFKVSQPAAGKWLKGESMPETKRLPAIARALEVRYEWLVAGEGSMLTNKIEETAGPWAYGLRPTNLDSKRVPVLDYLQAAQYRQVLDNYLTSGGMADVGIDPERAKELSMEAFALVVEGNSMEPDFKHGDVVIIDPARTPVPGSFVVAKLDREEKVTFRKYRDRGVIGDGRQAFELVPTNADYAPTLVNNDNPGTIIGVAVEHRRALT